VTIQWTQQNRALLDDILDQLIPANPAKGIPSAGAFGVGDFITARAMEDDSVTDWSGLAIGPCTRGAMMYPLNLRTCLKN